MIDREKMMEEKEYPIVKDKINLSHFAVIEILEDEGGGKRGVIHAKILDEKPDDWEEDPLWKSMDSLFSMALYHALAGVDVGSDEYARGFEHVVDDLVSDGEE